MCEDKPFPLKEIRKLEISSKKLRNNFCVLLRRDFLKCNSKKLTGLLKSNSKLYGYETIKMDEVPFDKQQRIITVKDETCENTRIIPLMGITRKDKEKTEKSRGIISKNSVITERNYSRKLQRVSSTRKHLLKDDTSNNTLDLVEKSSRLHITAAKRSSQESKYSYGNTKTGNFQQIQERKPLFCANSNSFSRFVVKALPSDGASSLTDVKMGTIPTEREAHGDRIVAKTTSRKCRNSPEIADSTSTKREELFSRFADEDNVARRRASYKAVNLVSSGEGKECPSPSFHLQGLKSHANGELLRQKEYKDYEAICENGEPEKESKPLNLENFACLEISDDFRLTKKDFSLDIKTLLNYYPSGSFSARDLEIKREISEPRMKICERPTTLTTRERAYQSSSRRSQEPKKPVSLPPKPVKPVRLRLKHRQDKFMSQREENSRLNEEEGRILPTTLSAWKKNCYSVMTPYMAKVVWSVMEDELTD